MIIAFNHKKDPGKNKDTLIPSDQEVNIADGGEFLDDGLRMKEQPFETTTPGENPGEILDDEPGMINYE